MDRYRYDLEKYYFYPLYSGFKAASKLNYGNNNEYS